MKGKQNNNRIGISLITLVITIIVVIILAAAVILTLNNNNPIETAKEAMFKSNISTIQDGLNLYVADKYANARAYKNNSEVASGLLTGTSWDTIMRWLENSVYNVTDSRTWGNHNDSLAPANVSGYGSRQPTGYSERWKSNNIYDLSGSMWEWNNESYSDKRVSRGGCYYTAGRWVSFRDYDDATYTSGGIGFRLMLYVKI